jgi:transglutaminase-like putative cysteine protease
MIDGVVRALAGDRPELLIGLDLDLESSTVAPGGWTGDASMSLGWTDINHTDILYDVHVSPTRKLADGSTPGATVSQPNVTFSFPQEGQVWVVVVPRTGTKTGSVNPFGPFGHDPSPPPAPALAAPSDPGGYTFTLTWMTVDDLSGIRAYELERAANTGDARVVASTLEPSFYEANLGNGDYTYRVRAVNGGGVASAWSAPVTVTVSAPMQNPGPGANDFGIHANYTSFLHLWDLSDPGQYLLLGDLSAGAHDEATSRYLGKEWGIETDNQTLKAIVAQEVGNEQNTFVIAQDLFLWLYEELDYDGDKASGADQDLLRAGETVDRGGGICGDLAVLYITLLRIAGVPARPVHGYLDDAPEGSEAAGEFHMWVEVYVGGDPDNPWMTVDVSGASADDPDQALFLFFGLFNPNYLSLGVEQVFDPLDAESASWNAWARFQWTCTSQCRPSLDSGGDTTNVEVEHAFLVVHPGSKQRVLADKGPGQQQPAPGDVPSQCQDGTCFFFTVDTKVVKRIDYGVLVETTPPQLKSLTVELRYPDADASAATNAYQSVVYTVYRGDQALSQPPPASGFYSFSESYDG